MNILLSLKIKFTAVKTLKKELGLKHLIKLLPGLSKRTKAGEPWRGMAEPQSDKDRESRALIGEAILLYRELKAILSPSEAERVVRIVIRESAVTQLKNLVPVICACEVSKLSLEEQRKAFTDIVDQFPNADYRMEKTVEGEYSYTITRCRLVELIEACGHPELRDAFCAGDGLFFERHQPEVSFNRPTTIGGGDEGCLFKFILKE
jgi:hypothetical protein